MALTYARRQYRRKGAQYIAPDVPKPPTVDATGVPYGPTVTAAKQPVATHFVPEAQLSFAKPAGTTLAAGGRYPGGYGGPHEDPYRGEPIEEKPPKQPVITVPTEEMFDTDVATDYTEFWQAYDRMIGRNMKPDYVWDLLTSYYGRDPNWVPPPKRIPFADPEGIEIVDAPSPGEAKPKNPITDELLGYIDEIMERQGISWESAQYRLYYESGKLGIQDKFRELGWSVPTKPEGYQPYDSGSKDQRPPPLTNEQIAVELQKWEDQHPRPQSIMFQIDVYKDQKPYWMSDKLYQMYLHFVRDPSHRPYDSRHIQRANWKTMNPNVNRKELLLYMDREYRKAMRAMLDKWRGGEEPTTQTGGPASAM